MKQFPYSNLAGLAVLLLILGMAPGALPGQDKSQPPAPPSPGESGHERGDIDISTEQIENEMRSIEKELKAELQNLQDGVKREFDMSSPELEKLQSLSAQLETKKDEIASRAEELVSKAQDRAYQIFEQEPGDFLVSPEDGSGWLGIDIGEVTSEKAKDLKLSAMRGVIVSEVESGSPAAKAGLKENDVILQYDGQTIEGTVQFRRLVRETPPGRSVTLGISRDGNAQSLSVELGDRGAFPEKRIKGRAYDFGGPDIDHFAGPNLDFHFDMPEVMDWRTPLLGISAEDLSGQLGTYFGAPGSTGILVREVRTGTPAEKAGLKAGDVIVQLDGKPIRALADLREQLRDKSDEKSVQLGILRRGAELTVSVAMEKPRPIEPIRMVHRAQL
jgi:serine protease Do